MIATYRDHDCSRGPVAMVALTTSVSSGIPAALFERRRLGRTLRRQANDLLANFDRPHTSNGPTEAINGRLEHLRGSSLNVRKLKYYIARSLLETGLSRP